MTARDELALELFIGDNANQPRETSIQDWTWFESARKAQGQVEHYKAMAEHALAAGYRKPRTITTAEELDTLPVGSVVLDRTGDVARRFSGGWRTTVMEPDGSAWLSACMEDADLPAKVLHEPEAEQ